MTIKHRQHIAALVTTITAVLGSVAAMAAPASAAEGPTRPAAQAQAPGSRATVAVGTAVATRTAVFAGAIGAGGRPAAGPTTITCETFVDPPEVVSAGSPFGGQVKPFNAIGSLTFTTCTAPVTSISMTSALLFNGRTETFGPTATSAGSFSASGAVLAFCAPGDWQSGAASNIVMPAGFTPSVLKLTATSGVPTSFTELDCNPGLL